MKTSTGKSDPGQATLPPKQKFEKEAVRVFYDGGCSLCRREIAHYQRLPGAERINWIDIDQPDSSLEELGLDHAAAMERLHVLDADGRWQTGAWAFATLWAALPRYRWLAWILRGTCTLGMLDRLYTLFARWRMRRRCVQPADGLAAPVCRHPNAQQSLSDSVDLSRHSNQTGD